MKVEVESNLHALASTTPSRLTYFGVLLTCSECGSMYSPKLRKCPSCGVRILGRERDEILKREKAGRIVEALKSSRLTPESIYLEVYRRPEGVHKYPSLRRLFAENVLEQLVFYGFIGLGMDDFVVLKQPSVDEVYDILWGERSQSKNKAKLKTGKKQAGYVDAVKEGDHWTSEKSGKVDGPVTPFFLLNSPESEESAIMIAKQNLGVKYNFEYTNEYRPTLERVDHLLLEIPNVGIIACSEWTWKNRLRTGLFGLVKILVIPRGGVKQWVKYVCRYVNELLKRGENLGVVCKNLNIFNIKISVKGLLKWHWKEIKRPPPVFVW